MKKPAKRPKKRAKKKAARVPNEKFGRLTPMPFKDVVGRLLETPPARSVAGKGKRTI